MLYIYIYSCTLDIFLLSISALCESSIFSHIECCILNAPVHSFGQCIFRCMAEFLLNDEALKHNHFTFGKICITLVIRCGDNVPLSHLCFHLPLARENYACS